MLKQSIIYLLLSILIVLFAKYAHLLINYISLFYVFLNTKLSPIFSNSSMGILSRKVLTLTLLPVLIAALPALIYRLLKGAFMPYFFELTWFIWIVVALSNLLIA